MQWLLRPTFRLLLNERMGNAHDATHSVGSHAVRDAPLQIKEGARLRSDVHAATRLGGRAASHVPLLKGVINYDTNHHVEIPSVVT